MNAQKTNLHTVIDDNEIVKLVRELVGHFQLKNVSNQKIPNVSETLFFKSGKMFIYLISNVFVDRKTASPKKLFDPLKMLFLSRNPFEITMTLNQMMISQKLKDFKEIIIKLLQKNMDLLDFEYLSVEGDTLMEGKNNQTSSNNSKGMLCFKINASNFQGILIYITSV